MTHRPRLHRDPPTSPPVDYRQMADDYCGIPSAEFDAKYPDWYPKHEAGLRAEFDRRRLDPDPLTVEPEPLDAPEDVSVDRAGFTRRWGIRVVRQPRRAPFLSFGVHVDWHTPTLDLFLGFWFVAIGKNHWKGEGRLVYGDNEDPAYEAYNGHTSQCTHYRIVTAEHGTQTVLWTGTEVDELASAWRSCLVRAGLLALALVLVGLAAVLVASDVR